MRAVLALVTMLLLLSGCGGRDSEAAPSPTDGQVVDAGENGTEPTIPAARAERPVWEFGQGWVYAVEIPGEPTRTFRMFVAEERDDLWVVATDNRTRAVHHAVYSTNPALGRIGKETLAPFQTGGPVAMFQFPLEDGKSWSGDFFGEEMDFTATYAGDIGVHFLNPELGLGEFVEGFQIRARGPASGTTVHYDYVEAIQWFTSFEVLDGTARRMIKLTLLDLIADESGEYHFFRGSDVLRETGSHVEPGAPETASFPTDAVPDDHSELVAIGVTYQGHPSNLPPSLTVTLVDPSGVVQAGRNFNGSRWDAWLIDVPGAPGTWTVGIDVRGSVDYEIRVAGLQVFAEGSL